MKTLSLAFVLLAVAGASACGVARPKQLESAEKVAALIRGTWGSTTGFPTFHYSCRRLPGGGGLFTCVARDSTDTVKLASFDVICDASACTWRAYPTYVG
jgi:hypothetical protein